MDAVEFTLTGRPITQGSKQPFIPTYKDGTPVRRHGEQCPYYGKKGKPEYVCRCPIMVNTVEDNAKELEAWREAVMWTAKTKMRSREPWDCLCLAVFVFYLHRPKNHYGTGANAKILKPNAPAAPGVIPDVGKLARAVEDGMSGTVYVDDSRLVTRFDAKRYEHPWEQERVEVLVRPCAVQTVADLIVAGGMPRPEEEFGQLGLLDALSA